jgi:cbb3-type cytochrome oxidase maturation protein
MSVIYIVLPLALLVALAAVIAYRWAARRGQFDDLVTPAIRMLHDDVEPRRDEEGEEGGPSRAGKRTE